MRNSKLLYTVLALFIFAVNVYGQLPDPPPDPGGGGVGPGSQSAPIDGYLIFLAVVAISFIVYFAGNYKKQKA